MKVLLLFACAIVVQCAEHNALTVPDSLFNPTACNAKRKGWVCDPDGLLTGNSNGTVGSDLLNRAIESVQQHTNCPCSECSSFTGTVISIVVVQKLKMASNETSPNVIMKAMKKFANDIRKRQARDLCDDDILIVLSVDQNAVQTSYGPGLATRLNDAVDKEIVDRAKSDFARQYWTNGLLSMVKNYSAALNSDTLVVNKPDTHWYNSFPLCLVIIAGALLVIIMVLLVISFMCCYHIGRRYTIVT